LGCFGRVLGLEAGDVCADGGIVPVQFEIPIDPGPRIAEQRRVDEVDRCGGTLDVQQDGADLGQRDAVFWSGMYVGPMQSG
jgi:hypothetical protein